MLDTVTNPLREAKITKIFLALTIVFTLGLYQYLARTGYHAYVAGNSALMWEAILFAGAMFFVMYGTLLYQICLIGHYKIRSQHRVPPREQLERFFDDADAPKLSIIIPSYKEERNVNWQTMMSAALSEYPTKNVVLLIDDPYHPKALADMVKLEDTRKIAHEMQAMFDAPRAEFVEAKTAFDARLATGYVSVAQELATLSEHFDRVADWLADVANNYMGNRTLDELPFADKFFVEQILHAPMARHRAFADSLRAKLAAAELPDMAFITHHYARLIGLFTINFSSFERKKYANLCHEANKAMNLNSYIALVGKSWKEMDVMGKLHLVECAADEADFTIPHADYINTIDSDSLMLGEYSMRLIDIFERPENHRLAVIQSPVSSFQGSPAGLERSAGACLDVQFKTHQGYTHWGATFWVGANAMLRHTALEEIKEIRVENGHDIAIYIQDRTVIEDTESTIDLVHKGWKLYNYPERMTFSANPPDFGSLLIQRRRWSNGGLIILPKLFRYVMNSKKDRALAKELFMRFHYLASTTTACVAAMIFMFYPFDTVFSSFWMPLAVAPFLVLFIRDLKNTGYTLGDGLRICAMNLMLFPVVVGGVAKSFQQILTGKKIPFCRTPKITGRTSAPAFYCLLELMLFGMFAYAIVSQALLGHYAKASYAAINAVMLGYALVRFIGVKALFEDMVTPIRLHLRNRSYSAEIIPLHSQQPGSPAPQMAASRN